MLFMEKIFGWGPPLFLISSLLGGCLWVPGGINPGVLKQQYPHVIYQGSDKPPQIKILKNRPAQWVSLSEVSKVAIDAIVISEDWAFYQHRGYDPNQIREAIREDLEEGRLARGASTITQQVVKNVFLGSEKSFSRKIKEIFVAVAMEQRLTKSKILEVYLNIAEWGEGLFGIGPASRFYFKKAPSELTPKEGAFLAMLLPSPKRYSQSFRDKKLTEYANKTIQSILQKMAQAKLLTEEVVEEEIKKPLYFEASSS